MNPELLFAHFNQISDAPEAVPHLRRFILDLAARGKLVEQDPIDEPASQLFQRIQAEKARLLKTSEIRKQKPVSPIDPDEVPFFAPHAWIWTRIRQVTSDRGQKIPDKEFTYIDVTAIDKEAGCVADSKVLSPADAPSRARKLVHTGDVLYSCVRPYLLNIAVIDTEITPAPIASTAFAVLNGFGLVLPKYLWIVLRSPFMVRCVEAKMRGQAYPAINDADFADLPFPLPPLAEQSRIVAKVDELMALCDRLEAARGERDKRLDHLTAASHYHLNNCAGTEASRKQASFYINHLPTITIRPEQIPTLREAILNLAVCGRIILQNENDEPVSRLLEQVRAEQQRLVATGAIPKFKVRSPDARAELAFEPPKSWEPIAFGRLCNIVTSGSRGWAEYYAELGPKFIRAQNIRFGKLRLDDLACVNPPKKSEGTRTQVSKGDLLVVITGAGVTNPALLDIDLGEAYVSQHVALIKPTDRNLSPWLLLCLMAPMGGRAELVTRAYGAGKPGLNLDNIRSLVIPLPPMAEQHRIITKVNELMVLCDRLERQLTTAQTESSRLLAAVLHHALSDTRQCALTS
jgi:type I restriction enzyme S subunit